MNPSQALLASDRQALQDDRAAIMRQVDKKLARGEATLEEKRAAVERDRADLDDEKARMRAAAPPPGEKIKLNVGGARFEASRAVLTKFEDSMLGRMFGRCDAMLQKDPDDGSIFIDRDGERFRLILDFLRDLDGSHMQRTIRALAGTARESMMKELDYFGLETAVFGGRPWTDDATFRPGPAMSSARVFCAALLAGGRVVVFGGSLGETISKTTEVLDTQMMTFTAGPNLLMERGSCAVVQIDADRVLVVGGYNYCAHSKATEIFHLSTRTVTPGPNMQSARNCCAAVALDSRRVLIVGGYDGRFLSTSEIFSLDTMVFAPGPAMAGPRFGCVAVALDEHRIMVAGGGSTQVQSLQTTEILDIRTMAFAPGPSMSSVRCACAAVPVDARHVLVIGGRDSGKRRLATTELLDVATMEFSPGPTMQAGRSAIAAVRLDAAGEDARFLVLGGHLSSTEVLTVDAERGVRATCRCARSMWYRRVGAMRKELHLPSPQEGEDLLQRSRHDAGDAATTPLLTTLPPVRSSQILTGTSDRVLHLSIEAPHRGPVSALAALSTATGMLRAVAKLGPRPLPAPPGCGSCSGFHRPRGSDGASRRQDRDQRRLGPERQRTAVPRRGLSPQKCSTHASHKVLNLGVVNDHNSETRSSDSHRREYSDGGLYSGYSGGVRVVGSSWPQCAFAGVGASPASVAGARSVCGELGGETVLARRNSLAGARGASWDREGASSDLDLFSAPASRARAALVPAAAPERSAASVGRGAGMDFELGWRPLKWRMKGVLRNSFMSWCRGLVLR